MAYPYQFYVYCVDSIDADVTALLDVYDIEYSSLPTFSDFNKYKISTTDKGAMADLTLKLEDVGAFYSMSRMITLEK